jgi:hypothetical protein
MCAGAFHRHPDQQIAVRHSSGRARSNGTARASSAPQTAIQQLHPQNTGLNWSPIKIDGLGARRVGATIIHSNHTRNCRVALPP